MPLTVATPVGAQAVGARLGTRRRQQHRLGCASRRVVAPRAVGVSPAPQQELSPTFAPPSQTVNSVKTRIVVLGTGWAAVSYLKQLSSGAGVDVTVVRQATPAQRGIHPGTRLTRGCASPPACPALVTSSHTRPVRAHRPCRLSLLCALFALPLADAALPHAPPSRAPVLPAAAVGSVEDRSIVEPIRSTLNKKGFTFLEAAALRINVEGRSVLCRAVDTETEIRNRNKEACPLHTFTLGYDILILAVGSIPNTFNTPGVIENAMFFKEVEHALRFRREALERFERASLPGTSAELARELLSFCVVGAGPTGVELAAELHDMVQQDVARLFPKKLLEYVSINIIDLQDFILSSYDRRIAEYATEQFKRQSINLYLGCGVKAVEPGMLLLSVKKTGEDMRIPFGLCVWCTGIKLNPLCEQLIKDLPPGVQPNIRSLTTDASLRVKGSGGTIFAMGDACTIELNQAAPQAAHMLAQCGSPEHGGTVDLAQLRALLRTFTPEFPHLQEAADRLDADNFEAAATSDGRVGLEGLTTLLSAADRGLRTLPATAQVAKQQGEYLAGLMNSLNTDTLTGGELPQFSYKHKGSLAYIGSDSAVADIPGVSVLKGILAGLVWKSFETVSQVSLRNQVLVFGDMLRSKVFGRDLSRV